MREKRKRLQSRRPSRVITFLTICFTSAIVITNYQYISGVNKNGNGNGQDLQIQQLAFQTAITPREIQDMHITPRAYPLNNNFPCVEDDNPELKDAGFLFIKLQKCASSTVANIVKRISKKYGKKNLKKGEACKVHCTHGFAFNLPNIHKRRRAKSFLFTFIREPTDRFVSDFFYHGVSKEKMNPSLANFTTFVDKSMLAFKGLGGYEFPYILTDKAMVPPQTAEYTFWNPNHPNVVQNPLLLKERVEYILHDFDFIGISGRMDESLVAFALLLKIPLTDVLYQASRRVSGGYDFNKPTGECFKMMKSTTTVDMKKYFDTVEWKAKIAGDDLLYRAANANLDKTILVSIGKEKFKKKLKMYREVKNIMDGVCGDADCGICTATGEIRTRSGIDPRCDINKCIANAMSIWKGNN